MNIGDLVSLTNLLRIINPYRWIKIIKLNFFPPNFNIGISIDDSNGKKSKVYHKELTQNLQQIIDQNNLNDLLKTSDFSELKIFKQTEEAESFRNNKKLDLLIWGDFSPDLLKLEGKNVVQPRIKFTFGHPLDAQNKLKDIILLELGSLDKVRLIGKIIKEDDSFREIRELPGNVFELSVYIIALSLKLFGKFDQSIFLFESLLSVQNPHDNAQLSIKLHLINLYSLKLQFFNWVNSDNKESSEALNLATKLLNLDNNNLGGLVAKAYHEYRLGQVKISEHTIEHLQKVYPLSHFTWIDIAFFSITQKNYKRAYDYYDRLTNVTNPQFDVIQVLDFIDQQYDLDRKELGFLFASGFINFLFADKLRSKKLLKLFVKKANENIYKSMFRRAKKILNNEN